MRKLLGYVLLLVLVAAPAYADHPEPTAPVLTFELTAQRYGTDVFVDCSGVEPFPFTKVRLLPLISVAAAPSEHFDVRVETEIEETSPKGQRFWTKEPGSLQTTWAHQNIAPHAQNLSHANAAYPSDMAGLTPGRRYRSTWTITTDVSEQVLTDSCIINVA